MCRSASTLLALLALVVAGCVESAGGQDASAEVEEIIGDRETAVGHYGFGEEASPEQIAGWDIDIRPDGKGLPPGSATAEDGEMLYEEECALCHGSFGEGVGRYPVLAGGEGTLTEARPERTVGSFWPYASTLWDYIHRAMPYAEPESLSDEEVYAITAYVLYLNDLVDYDFELSAETLASVEMPNREGFFVDDRPDVKAERCMEDCKDPDSIEILSEPELVTAGVDESGMPLADTGTDTAGSRVYDRACAVCHDSGVGDAPIPGEAGGWDGRADAGRDALIATVIDGKGLMPPRAGQPNLSDDDIGSAVDYMLGTLE